MFFLPGVVVLPCDHGLDFLHAPRDFYFLFFIFFKRAARGGASLFSRPRAGLATV